MSVDVQLNRICVATDFSETSERAVQHAASVAEKFGAEVHLLHVLQDVSLVAGHSDFTGSGQTVESFLEGLESEAVERLHELTSTPLWERLQTVRVVRHGLVGQEICGYAESEKIDLLALGTHGRTGLTHVFLGSVAEYVVRRAACAVLTVRHPEHQRGTLS